MVATVQRKIVQAHKYPQDNALLHWSRLTVFGGHGNCGMHRCVSGSVGIPSKSCQEPVKFRGGQRAFQSELWLLTLPLGLLFRSEASTFLVKLAACPHVAAKSMRSLSTGASADVVVVG